MRPRDLRRGAAAAVLAAAIAAAGLLVPGTSGAFSSRVANTSDRAATKSVFTCGDLFTGTSQRSRAYFEYSLAEAAGATTAADSGAAANPGTYLGTTAKDPAAPQACPADGGRAWLLDGSTHGLTTSSSFFFDGTTVQPLTLSIWFRTSTASGKLIGFESSQTGTGAASWDKQLYVGGSGRLYYGVYSGATETVATPGAVTDGAWHQAVATTSAAGSVLYLDGAAVASDATMTLTQAYTGWWRVGAGKYVNWPDAPAGADTGWFTGSLRFAAALRYAMSAEAVRSSYRIGLPG